MKMKKLINEPDSIADELLEGLAASHADLVELTGNRLLVRRRPKAPGKVPIVFGQGVGHEPGYDGMLGYGMHDVEVPGDIFTCASGQRIFEGIKLAWEQSGHTPVLVLVANHEGDVLNARAAMELAEDADIDARHVLLYDDIATAPKGRENERRGMAGMTFSFKVAGAMSELGADRDAIIKKVAAVNAATRTLAVAVRSATIPTSGQALFALADDEIVIGPGVHGEAGPEGPIKLPTADEAMRIVAERVIEDGEIESGSDVLVLLNGSGSTTLMELFILYRSLASILETRNIRPHEPLIGNVVTTQEMAGFSLSLCPADDDTKTYWSATVHTPYFKKFGPELRTP